MADQVKHPLENIITTIYADPLTRKKKEGRAKVIKVVNSNRADEYNDAFTCDVHFIGDRRGYNVQRIVVMRRAHI